MSRSRERPMGMFDGFADKPIPEDRAKTHFGFTRQQWTTNPRIRGAPLNPRHVRTRIGHVISPYIGQHPKKKCDMLAFRGALYLDDPLGERLYQKIRNGDSDVFLSIDYDTAVSGGVKTGQELMGIGLVPNPRDPDCVITVRQSEDGEPTLHWDIPVQWVAAMLQEFPLCPSVPSTKTSPLPLFINFPVLPASSTTATTSKKAITMQAPPTTTAAADNNKSEKMDTTPTQPPAAAAAPPAQEPKQPSVDAMKQLEELQKKAAMAEVAMARLKEYESREADRLKKEAEDRRKTLEGFKDHYGSMGINAEDEAHKTALNYLIDDPSPGSQLVFNWLKQGLEAHSKNSSELEKTKKEYEEVKNASAEMAKRLRTGVAFGSREPEPASAGSAQQRDAQLAADAAAAKKLTLSPLSGALTPSGLASLKLPSVIQTGNSVTTFRSGPNSSMAGAPPGTLIGVQQDAATGTPSTGDPVAAFAQQWAQSAQNNDERAAAQTLVSTRVQVAGGQTIDLTQCWFEGGEKRDFDMSFNDRLALANALQMRNNGYAYKSSNDPKDWGIETDSRGFRKRNGMDN